ncbi:hypothetical protein HK096_007127 [Nowakowskiella sp. JEL0078]|nr:hypothetical protein HK096_007127 [Nowakowskiella sp. JEL0078]
MDQIRDLAIDWALAHGLVVRTSSSESRTSEVITHAPFALFPSKFPASAFNKAITLQPLFNTLVDKLAADNVFIETIMESLSQVDEFTGKIYNIYKFVQSEGVVQRLSLGVHRSDYLLHEETEGVEPVPQQVELNTIASSFGSLSTRISELHHYLAEYSISAISDFTQGSWKLAQNISINGIPKAIAAAYNQYKATADVNSKLVVVMVVQPGERNVFDQRWIEFNLATE